MKIGSYRLVIHDGYGGFSIPKEVVDLLIQRGWSLFNSDNLIYDYTKGYFTKSEDQIPERSIIKEFGLYNFNRQSGDRECIRMRSNEEFIECLEIAQKELEEKYERNEILYREYYYNQLRKLKVVEGTINLEIEIYNNGHERINVHAQNDF